MFYSFGSSDFYSYVVSALINEAIKEGKHVYPDYRYGEKLEVDIFLPNGLTVLGKTFKKPYVVEISNKPNHDNRLVSSLQSMGFAGTLFIISQNLSREKNVTTSTNFDVVRLGRHFLLALNSRNKSVYLNNLLGVSDLSFRNELAHGLYLSSNKDEEKKTPSKSKDSKEKLKINKNEAEKICTINENDFKAYFNRDFGKNNCAIFVGNGASIPFGSDNWSALIKNLVDRLEPFHIEKREHIENALSNSSYALSSFVKNVLVREETESKYIDALRFCIYRKYNNLMHNQKSLVKVIASAKEKYQFLPILTYNYDTFIERQFGKQAHKSLRYFSNDYNYESIDDIVGNNVIHLHGYISYKENHSKGVILTDEEYFNAYLNEQNWVYKTQIDVLRNYTCLFVGSSMSDLFQMSLIQKARNGDLDGKWNCFALMCLKNLEFNEKMKIIKYYKEKGIRIILVNSFEELPNKLADLLDVKDLLDRPIDIDDDNY